MHGQALLDLLRPRRDAMVQALKELVEYESPSIDKEVLDRLAEVLAGRLGAVGCDVEIVPDDLGGDHLRARFPAGARRSEAPALVLGHFDTVWEAGTLAQRPFRVAGGRAYGPGTFDMKAGLVVIEFALGAIRDLGLMPPRSALVLLTSDEEVGSGRSRALIEAQARGCAYALVLEPPLPGGRLKTARKAVGRFEVNVVGRAAHAGVEPEKGISAILELATQLLRIQGLARPEAGTTINVGEIKGGTKTNVVPERAWAAVDVRVTSRAEELRITGALKSLEPVTPGAGVFVTGEFRRPAMERTPAIADLFRRAQEIGRGLGLELEEGATGGGSDGNFTAALGVPTLDGLGVLGAGAHAETEHILIDSLSERAALLAALLLGL